MGPFGKTRSAEGGPRRGIVDAFTLRATSPDGRRAFVLRFGRSVDGRRSGVATGEVWAAAFERGGAPVVAKETMSIACVRFADDAPSAEVGPCAIDARGSRGAVETGARRVQWDVTFQSPEAAIDLIKRSWLHDRGVVATALSAPAPDATLAGTVSVNGAPWNVDGFRAVVEREKGREHAPHYAWGHVATWDGGGDLVLEGLSARIGVGIVRSPLVTAAWVRTGGDRFAMSGLSRLVVNEGEVTPRRWRFRAESGAVAVRGELWAETDELVGVFHRNPDGRMLHALHAGLARARVEVRIGKAPPRVATSSAAALEIGTMDAHHGVRMYV